MQYLIPSIISLDSSKMHLFKNQATCGPEILGSVELSETDFGDNFFGCGFALKGDQVQICLTGSIDDNLLDGLTVNTSNGSSFVTSNCSLGDPFDECDAVSYVCDVDGTTGPGCVTSLECADGTLIDTCENNSVCTNF